MFHPPHFDCRWTQTKLILIGVNEFDYARCRRKITHLSGRLLDGRGESNPRRDD